MMKSNQKWLKKTKILVDEIQERVLLYPLFLIIETNLWKTSKKISEKTNQTS